MMSSPTVSHIGAKTTVFLTTLFPLIVDTKAIYDIYGEYGLKEGCVTAEGKKIGGGYFLKQ